MLIMAHLVPLRVLRVLVVNFSDFLANVFCGTYIASL